MRTAGAPTVGSAPGARPPRRLWGPPPWLWLTLGLLVTQTPALAYWLTWTVAEGRTWDGRTLDMPTTLALTLVQVLPLLFLLAGALSLVAPRRRGRYVERRYGLLAPDHPDTTSPTTPDGADHDEDGASDGCDGMRRFLAERAPRTELRISIRRDLVARVYPGLRRSPRIGVFSPLLRLWDEDRDAAEAILLHELGHLRYGEQHVAGLGSPFTALVRAWPYLVAVFGLLPAVLLFVSGVPAPFMHAQIVLVLLSVPKILLIMVGALWSAELAADRYAAQTAGWRTQLRALNALQEHAPGGLARLYHPPVRMRLWFAARTEQRVAQALLLLLWPLAVCAENALDLLGALLGYHLLGASGPVDATRTALSLARGQLTSGPQWWAILAALAVWPLAADVWQRLRGRHDTAGTFSPTAYVTSALLLLPALALALGFLPAAGTAGDPSRAESPTPGGSTTAAGAPPTPCPTRSRPAAPARPAELPGFDALPTGGSTSTAAPSGGRVRAFRTVRVLTAERLSGADAQVQDTADRLRHARWTLHADGTLSAGDPALPVLHTTAVRGDTRLLYGEQTRTTDVSATTTWLAARLRTRAGHPARLELVRATTGVTHAVVACREFDSTVTAAIRLDLQLEEG
ncbi:hypothetical protein [Streptomyces sp. NPDC007264]|uniref:hypothetical protein n=1 Tax=Streptomyces sp. NPDC007264 TaxID=3364777 RepID=UPI0036DAE37B